MPLVPAVRTGILGVAVVAVLILGSELYLPAAVQSRLEAVLVESLRPDGPMEAVVETSPAVRTVFGRLDAVHVEAEGVDINGLRVDRLTVEGRNVRVDVPHLVQTRQVRVLSADVLEAMLWVSEEDLDRYVVEESPVPGSFKTEVNAGGMSLRGDVTVLGQRWPVGVEGTLRVAAPNRIDFIPTGLAVDQVTVPPALLAGLVALDDFRIGVNLSDLPLSLEVVRIDFEPGWVKVTTRSAAARHHAGVDGVARWSAAR